MKIVSLEKQIEDLVQRRTELAQKLQQGTLEQRTKCLIDYNKIVTRLRILEDVSKMSTFEMDDVEKTKETAPLIRSVLNPYATPYVKGKGKEWLRQHQKPSSGWGNFRFMWIKKKKGNWTTAGRKWKSLTTDEKNEWKNHNDALIAGYPGIN